jgi:hypothetical protein
MDETFKAINHATLSANEAVKCQTLGCKAIFERPGREDVPNFRYYCLVTQQIAQRKHDFNHMPTTTTDLNEIGLMFDRVEPQAIEEVKHLVPEFCIRHYNEQIEDR